MNEENEYLVIPMKRKNAKERNIRRKNIKHKIHSDKEGWGGERKEAFFDLFTKSVVLWIP